MNLKASTTRKLLRGSGDLRHRPLSACSSAASLGLPSAAASSFGGSQRSRPRIGGSPGVLACQLRPACGTVNIAQNAWAGYYANVAVISYILKKRARLHDVVKNLSEQIAGRVSRPGRST